MKPLLRLVVDCVSCAQGITLSNDFDVDEPNTVCIEAAAEHLIRKGRK